jgi:aspartyl-tRNA(Asn)/glutamyl-tRNA(Gln) amidotransferase subunit A
MYRTIHEAAVALRDGKVTPLQLLDQCLERIDRYESKVHAWVFVDREAARAQAEAMTQELKGGSRRGPLHGIPIGVKDIYDVFDWPTAAGSKLWAQSYARQDAPVVQYLRSAGAVFVGKTVTTAYASFDPPPTRNPWNLARTPGGSSSGSAAGLACGMCLGALGSQTGGSITRPASYCGVTGCKPTYGIIPLEGIVPLAHSMDHPGPMATCVRDLAIMLTAMKPPYTKAINGEFLTESPPPRIGRLRGLFHDRAEPAVRDMMERVSNQFRKREAQVEPIDLPADFSDVVQRHRIVMAVESAQFHEPRLRRHPEDYPPKFRSLVEEGLATSATEYARTKEHQTRLQQAILAPLGAVDVLLAPATTGPAPSAETTGDPAFNSPWSYTGLPVVSMVAGWTDDGMPLAIQLVGRPCQEEQLLAVALWCERVLGMERREPTAS